MKHFLLIHGSWHGAWCWYKVAPRLEAAGHLVCAIDLPGRGRNPAHPLLVSLDRMVGSAAVQLPADRKTTIVVHSRYGIVASRLAETFPERIERTIYLAAFMLPQGGTAASYFRSDKWSSLAPGVEVSRKALWDRLRPEFYRDALYHDCSDDDNALARSMLCREPLRPAVARLRLTPDRYGRVPRAYIRLTEDRAVSPSLQDRMLNETDVDRVESIEASHSAYFSRPEALTGAILKLAGN
ncbi:MAG: alpha/beta fold hydrolase [Polyangiales bacterium]